MLIEINFSVVLIIIQLLFSALFLLLYFFINQRLKSAAEEISKMNQNKMVMNKTLPEVIKAIDNYASLTKDYYLNGLLIEKTKRGEKMSAAAIKDIVIKSVEKTIEMMPEHVTNDLSKQVLSSDDFLGKYLINYFTSFIKGVNK
jgi:sensor histidine kinase regulating citrate/malate metabolism